MNAYAIYLRKSRADMDAEARGEGETLARHRTALRALAQRRGLNVVQEYAELVTGDSIAARPQMQALLDDVKRGLYAGVIVNDIDRLSRGDSIDQEIIKYTFAASHCVIITPSRDIDPASPLDQDMLDFSLLFGRLEYRKISQRLIQGRTRSAAAGNYISSRVPYGYKKTVDGKRISLEPDPNTAPIVQMIFNWYVRREHGYHAIAEKLNDMGLRTYRGKPFERATVKNMLENPVYTGRIVWGKQTTVNAIENGKRVKKYIRGNPIVIENAHPAIISDEVFNAVQEMFVQSRHASHVVSGKTLANPLAGLAYCSCCGKLMILRGGQNKRLLTCKTRGCPTVGVDVYVVVDAILSELSIWTAIYSAPAPQPHNQESDEVTALKRQADQIKSQITRAQELVELGAYTPSEYIERKKTLTDALEAVNKRLEAKQTICTADAIQSVLPSVNRVLDAFREASTVEQENELLKSVISRVVYTKTHASVKGENPADYLTIDVFPKLGR